MRQADDRDDEDNDFDLQGIQDDAIIDYRRLLAIVSYRVSTIKFQISS